MSRAPGSLAFILPILVKIFTGPGKFLLGVSALSAILLLVITIEPAKAGLTSAYFFIALAIIGLIAIITFAIRGTLLAKRVDDAERTYSATVGTEIIPAGQPTSESDVMRERFDNARIEASNKKARFFPRVEAAQRAGIAAAGGLAHAPFLKADLRVTIVAGIIAIATAPVGFFLSFVAAILY